MALSVLGWHVLIIGDLGALSFPSHSCVGVVVPQTLGLFVHSKQRRVGVCPCQKSARVLWEGVCTISQAEVADGCLQHPFTQSNEILLLKVLQERKKKSKSTQRRVFIRSIKAYQHAAWLKNEAKTWQPWAPRLHRFPKLRSVRSLSKFHLIAQSWIIIFLLLIPCEVLFPSHA